MAWTTSDERSLGAADSRLEPTMQDAQPRPVGSYRWIICALLFFATTINYVDRTVLGVLEPELQKVTGWTATQYGDINSSFNLAYAIGFLFAGWMMDRIGTRWGYSISLAVWSLAAAAHAFAGSVVGFAVARFALGPRRSGEFSGRDQNGRRMVSEEGASARHGNFQRGIERRSGPRALARADLICLERLGGGVHRHGTRRHRVGLLLVADLSPSSGTSTPVAGRAGLHRKRSRPIRRSKSVGAICFLFARRRRSPSANS